MFTNLFLFHCYNFDFVIYNFVLEIVKVILLHTNATQDFHVHPESDYGPHFACIINVLGAYRIVQSCDNLFTLQEWVEQISSGWVSFRDVLFSKIHLIHFIIIFTCISNFFVCKYYM